MAPKKEPDRERDSTEWAAVSRQSRALEEIDELVKSERPSGEKLKKVVEDHIEACEDIKTNARKSQRRSVGPPAVERFA